MGVRHQGDRPVRRRWLATFTPIALLAAGVLAGTPAAVLAVAPAAASTPDSSQFAYGCGASSAPGKARCLVIENMTAHPTALTVRPDAVPAGSGFGPSQLQSAYGLTSASAADGAGTTVAIVDAFNDPTAASDLAAYRSAAGLPALTTGQFTQYNQEAQTSPLPAAPPTGDDWTLEESLDVDMVSAICPLCKIDLIEADNDQAINLLTAELTAAALGARYISDSWGFPENAADTVFDSAVFGVPGVVYVAGAGEGGFNSMNYPASSPNVVSVGGTTLATSSNSRGWTEGVWFTAATATAAVAGTGSGCSAFEPQPTWQTSVSVIPPACSKRVDNDVAADADPNTGAAIFDTSSQKPSQGTAGWFEAGGTSEATPIIASVFALAGNNGDGGNKAADSIYTHTSNLNVVTAGNNGTCTPPAADAVLCTATGATGAYNGPTGWGTPNGITGFASNFNISNTVTITNPGSQSGTVGTAARLQLSASDSASGQTLALVIAGLPPGLSISSTGLISGTPTTAGTSQVTFTVADTTGASATASFTWTINPGAGGGSSSSPSASSSTSGAASASPTPSCSSSAAAAHSASPTATISPSPLTSASPSSSASASPSSSASPSPSSSASAHVTSLVSAALNCSALATHTPSASPSATTSAPAPTAVSSSLAVTG
jgi:subtilase family serine protease